MGYTYLFLNSKNPSQTSRPLEDSAHQHIPHDLENVQSRHGGSSNPENKFNLTYSTLHGSLEGTIREKEQTISEKLSLESVYQNIFVLKILSVY